MDVDQEALERVKLREEAALALGLASSSMSGHGSESGHSAASNGTLRDNMVFDQEDDYGSSQAQAPNNHHQAHHYSPFTSTTSLHPFGLTPLSATLPQTRGRSGSMPATYPFHPSDLPQSFQTSTKTAPPPQAPQITPVPPFPSTWRALSSFVQTASSGTLPKYYPSSSLRIFAMGKQWKARHLILTTPTTLSSVPHNVHVSYLHLFKSTSRDDRELERLEINEDTVIFVSEEEIGGKKGVMQVAGVDVGLVVRESGNKKNTVKDIKGREQLIPCCWCLRSKSWRRHTP